MSQLHIFTSEPHHILASSDVHTFISSHHKSLHLYISTYPPISFYACLIHLHLLSFRHLHIFPSQLHISLYSSSLSGHPSSSFFYVRFARMLFFLGFGWFGRDDINIWILIMVGCVVMHCGFFLGRRGTAFASTAKRRALCIRRTKRHALLVICYL